LNKTHALTQLFRNLYGINPDMITALPGSGSYREYFRMSAEDQTAIGVFNLDKKENNAFLTFTKHFKSRGINVPGVLGEDPEHDVYMLEDLGDTTVFNFLMKHRKDDNFPETAVEHYRRIVTDLPNIQVRAGKNLDYSVCYPRSSFDEQSIMWDLNYFKYYFLKLARVPFDEQLLENDYQLFCKYLLSERNDFFLYRDFQSANVMLHQGEPWYIDYQGGRKGALQYDLASLLFDAKADLPNPVREELLGVYIENLKEFTDVDEEQFIRYYYGFVLIRLMQAMGAFGFRGLYEQKASFLKSIPYAIRDFAYILENYKINVKIPHLEKVLYSLSELPELKKYREINLPGEKLTIEINSFSYRRGIPIDWSENGGGYVFDCRTIPNPGRFEAYKNLSGLDREVKDFFSERSDSIDPYLDNVLSLISQSIDTYQERKYTNLMVNFGCTGGQHRSVYCAERISKKLKEKYSEIIDIRVHHLEQDLKKDIL